MPVPVLPQPAPTALPAPLVRDLVKALGEAASGGKPLPPAFGAALGELERLVRRRPAGDPDRTFLEGLRAASLGPAGEAAWARAAKSLHQSLGVLGGATAASLPLWEHLADLQAAQGLPDYPFRDRALQLRLDRARGVDPALEEDVLASLKDHWGGFLEPPRRPETLRRCADLTGLWLRRLPEDRARAMARVAFQEGAGGLWAFAHREGDPDLRSKLEDLLRDLPLESQLTLFRPEVFRGWVTTVGRGGLKTRAQALVLRLDPMAEAAWGLPMRLSLLRVAGLEEAYESVALEALDRLEGEALGNLVREELPLAPTLGLELAQAIRRVLTRELPIPGAEALTRTWVRRFRILGFPREAAALAGEGEATVPQEPAATEPKPSAEKEAFTRSFEAGRMEEVEAFVWSHFTAMVKGEDPLGSGPLEIAGNIPLLVDPWLRRRAPEEAWVRLERIETLLRGRGHSLHSREAGELASLRRKAERQQRLLALLGPAADP